MVNNRHGAPRALDLALGPLGGVNRQSICESMAPVAQHMRVIVTDDLDGSEGAKTYRFAWQEASYEVDLSDAHRDELLRALQPYIDAARRTRRSRATPAARPSSEEQGQIRAWARENGHEVSDRGRIPTKILDAYSNR